MKAEEASDELRPRRTRETTRAAREFPVTSLQFAVSDSASDGRSCCPSYAVEPSDGACLRQSIIMNRGPSDIEPRRLDIPFPQK